MSWPVGTTFRIEDFRYEILSYDDPRISRYDDVWIRYTFKDGQTGEHDTSMKALHTALDRGELTELSIKSHFDDRLFEI